MPLQRPTVAPRSGLPTLAAAAAVSPNPPNLPPQALGREASAFGAQLKVTLPCLSIVLRLCRCSPLLQLPAGATAPATAGIFRHPCCRSSSYGAEKSSFTVVQTAASMPEPSRAAAKNFMLL
ncbi:hypothetical protein [Desulfotomaculum nigrificans]|uniref:hypothetical protein n=1 Tax=Desulfotomaculum nigrificans TaxID=1565 RepID=UPI0012DDEE7C|nr:hypothetical protein [Desulfotomaculum nigrificans]